MRIWLSGPRIHGGLITPGINLGREDLQRLRGSRTARLPSWRRYELWRGLQAAATKRGEAHSGGRMAGAGAGHHGQAICRDGTSRCAVRRAKVSIQYFLSSTASCAAAILLA